MSDWKKAAIRWVERKQGADGTEIRELIYELDEEPDSLRQVVIPASDSPAEIRRGDRVLIDPDGKKIRADV